MLYLAVLWLDPATGRSATGRCCSTRSRSWSSGVQLVSLGILAELVTAYNIRAEDTYSIAETIPSNGREAARRQTCRRGRVALTRGPQAGSWSP